MKITIELSDTEIKGLKAYLKSVNCNTTKKDIELEIKNMIYNQLQCGSVGDYVNHFTHPDIYPKFWK